MKHKTWCHGLPTSIVSPTCLLMNWIQHMHICKGGFHGNFEIHTNLVHPTYRYNDAGLWTTELKEDFTLPIVMLIHITVAHFFKDNEKNRSVVIGLRGRNGCL